MRKNSLLRKDAPACLPEKFANPNADSYAITGLQGITGITGLALATTGGGVNLEVAAAGNTEVYKAKLKVANTLGLNDKIEDILISLGKGYHLIRPLSNNTKIFLYLVLDRGKANLAMARHELKSFENSLDFS